MEEGSEGGKGCWLLSADPSAEGAQKLWNLGGGGVLRFELDWGVPLEPQNPYPSLRMIMAEKGTPF